LKQALLVGLSKSEYKTLRRKKLLKGGVKTRFQKGVVSFRPPKNVHYSPATEFHKGHLPANHKQVGTIRTRLDKSNHQYRDIKLSGILQGQHRWIPYAVYILQQNNLEIPKGCFPIHEDGNTLNDSLGNLRIVSRRENMALMKERNPGWKKKAIRNYKKTVLSRRKIKTIQENIIHRRFIKKQREIQAEQRDKELINSGKTASNKQMVIWWECTGCSFEFHGKIPPLSCPKCNNFSFERIEQPELTSSCLAG
jgi:rubrerythrin